MKFSPYWLTSLKKSSNKNFVYEEVACLLLPVGKLTVFPANSANMISNIKHNFLKINKFLINFKETLSWKTNIKLPSY
jgi:hypothetical protein